MPPLEWTLKTEDCRALHCASLVKVMFISSSPPVCPTIGVAPSGDGDIFLLALMAVAGGLHPGRIDKHEARGRTLPCLKSGVGVACMAPGDLG